MRATIWFVLLFAVAVVAAATLGSNDGLVALTSRKQVPSNSSRNRFREMS